MKLGASVKSEDWLYAWLGVKHSDWKTLLCADLD
jgi:hypothetical protein